MTLAPNAFLTVIQEYGPLSSNQLMQIRAGKAAIWAWGGISYKDAFGIKRKTWFRLIYAGQTHTTPEGGMAFDAEGNGAD